MWTWLRTLLARREPAESTAPEADAATDPAVAKARPKRSTGTFVGRTARDDEGYAGETGAERRQEET
ncbi:hypothetical protein [Prauserella flavalba]|uniref:Uncharacterized protein n=1 Tax=Prauserella flavalba TaxID=1477506 RepID=A0A318LK12_9PSEU|nr:hypothetical protein [Prauserella flavalba]PXY24166.1 hypothetical protein BA062_28400 [Prauserella flavalba]